MSQGIPLGPYLLVRRLAQGGMAEVFLAHKTGPEGFSREVAVKRILPHLAEDPDFTSMFLDEARIAARLTHPNVVQVFDFGEADGAWYLAMELVHGVDLRAVVARARDRAIERREPGAVPPHHAAKILSFVCEGLAHAHALTLDGRPAGLVHRDVTPGNVLLSFDGAVKVADFGVAKLNSAAQRRGETRIGTVKGKHPYLSPEQARGEPLDARSDLFTVGVLLFEVLSGDSLFPRDDGRRARELIARGEIPDSRRLEALPDALEQVTRRALAAAPADRYPDALALRADLEHFLRGAAHHSDAVELGAYLRELFPEALHESRARAAGTMPGTEVLDDEGELPAGAPSSIGAGGAETDADTEPITAQRTVAQRTAVPTSVERPGGRPRRRALAIALAAGALTFVAALGIGGWLVLSAGLGSKPGTEAAEPAATEVAQPPAPATPAGDAAEPPSPSTTTAGRESTEPARTTEETSESRLRIVSTPEQAEVRVDGQRAGTTPLEVEVEPGEHAVAVAREGYETSEQTARIEGPGERATLSFALRPAPEPDPEPRDRRARRPRGRGELTIATTPWSEVYLGGRHLGTTPLSGVRLPAGKHVLTLRAPDRPPRKKTVVIRRGEETRVRVVL